MKHTGLTRVLHTYSSALFVLFFVLALWAFWSSYYGVLRMDHPRHIHLHGITMTLWCLMLIAQASLIRFRQYRIHHITGRLSYVLVPCIIMSGLHIAHYTISQARPGSVAYYYMGALMFNSLIVFAIIYGLAIWHRKTSAVHARYMLCTIFPLVTPITDRIIYKNYRELVPLVPRIEGMPVVPAVGFALADIILLILIIWDWRAHGRLNVFPVVLGLLLIYHLSVLTWYGNGMWQDTVHWFMRLPLS